MSLLIRGARVIPGDGSPALPAIDVRVANGVIGALDVGLETLAGERVLDAQGRVLMPGFVDAHTHALWAGDRLDEFELRLRGATYLEILAAGGGIHSTVRAVRRASEDELVELLLERTLALRAEGTTSLEVKSGYGLSTDAELKMLRAIRRVSQKLGGAVVPTALLGHALDPEEPNFVDRVIEETLPAVHAEFPDVAIDAYCEAGAWSLADCRRLFERAAALGHPLRLHADQFHALGGVELAIELGAKSVDHLEATPPDVLGRLARSATTAVLLPASGFHLDDRYADARQLLDAGGKLVLASNYNPGSAPSPSMAFVIALAVRKLELTVAEAIQATTSAPAHLLGLHDRGRIAPGARADLLLLRHRDERLLGYEVGGNPVAAVIARGKIVDRDEALLDAHDVARAQ
jgi:imidazolonepropionase